MSRRSVALVTAMLALASAVPGAFATQVKIFQTQSQPAFLAGTLEGLSVDPLGRLELAHRAERLTALAEPFLLSAAAHPDGWVVGTGNAGRVLKVDREGRVTELFAAPEPEVFAVWADADGTVFAGTSPRGKVYRIAAGKPAEVFFEPGETYIWDLARGDDGSLLVATGTQGKLFRVDARGRGEVVYDSDDTHLRTLAPLPGGDLLVGTAGEGLVLRVTPKGEARTLYDATQPEVVALAPAAGGAVYAAVVASEASLVDPAKSPPSPASGSTAATGGEATVVVTAEGESTAATGSRGFKGPRSELLRLSPSGVVESLWTSEDETVYDLLWQGDRLWVGTGLEGKLYSWDGAQMLLEKDIDERQVVTLVPGEHGPAFASTNAAAVYRMTAGTERSGTYTSAALDAGQVSRFGSFRWRGETPPGAAVRFSFRSGMSSEPDRTWSPWTEAREGRELSLGAVPAGRYLQWRAELRSGSDSPSLWGAEASYRQENMDPKIDSFAALEPGQILVPANFNPSNQVFEPAHPNREGIFTTLEPASGDDDSRLKPLWKRGYRSLRWNASDPNGDRLAYELSFRPAGGDGSGGSAAWRPMAKDLAEDHYSFDATVLPDGVYRFRLTASDRPTNEEEGARTAFRVSEPVLVDHTGPVLVEARRDGAALLVTVRDELSPVREAVYSVDAAEWKPAPPTDGLLDGGAETLRLETHEGDGGTAGPLLLLRVTDAAYNVVTFDLSAKLR